MKPQLEYQIEVKFNNCHDEFHFEEFAEGVYDQIRQTYMDDPVLSEKIKEVMELEPVFGTFSEDPSEDGESVFDLTFPLMITGRYKNEILRRIEKLDLTVPYVKSVEVFKLVEA